MERVATGRVIMACAAAGALLLSFASHGAVAHAAAGANVQRSITVMTRNLDEGTDFGYVVAAAQGQLSLSDAIALTYQEVLSSDVCGRAVRMADEIAAAKPDLVSLQEVARWVGPVAVQCAGTLTTTIDAQTALLAELAADKAPYIVAGEEDEFDSSSVPSPVTFLDRDLLLQRVEPPGRLFVSHEASAHYTTILPLPLTPELTVPILRGWISVDATVQGRTVRVVATHLESFYEPVQEAQAAELVAGPANTTKPVIIAGDLNTGPGSAQVTSYGFLTSPAGGGFTDTWSVTHPGDPGYTDAFYSEDPFTPTTPSERIDLVLMRGALAAVDDAQTGTAAPYPSDHAGVVAKIRILS